jgi:mediator of RNA polymerase II transcription subunit 8
MKQLNNEKIPSLHNHVTLPNQVSTDRDTELERVTEGRVPILHHEVVPDYLRTKLELDLEARQRDLHSAAAKPSPQFQEDLKKYNNLLDKVISLIDDARDSWEKQSNRGDNLQVNSLEDTKKLVVAYTSGGGLQLMSQSRRVMLMGGRPLGQQQPIQQPMMQQPMARTISRVAPPMGGGARPPMSMTPPNTNPQFYQTSPYKMR